MTDPILIAGAGPVGLTLAVELARYGVPVRIIDSAAAASATSKPFWGCSARHAITAAICSADILGEPAVSPAVLVFGS